MLSRIFLLKQYIIYATQVHKAACISLKLVLTYGAILAWALPQYAALFDGDDQLHAGMNSTADMIHAGSPERVNYVHPRLLQSPVVYVPVRIRNTDIMGHRVLVFEIYHVSGIHG